MMKPRMSERTVKSLAKTARRIWTVPTIRHGIERGKRLSRKGGGVILNILGEHHTKPEDVGKDLHEYENLIRSAAREREIEHQHGRNLNVRISIKPSQFGFDLPNESGYVPARTNARREATRENMWRIVKMAVEHNIPVEVDIESSRYHDFTFDTYNIFRERLKEIATELKQKISSTEKRNLDREFLNRWESALISIEKGKMLKLAMQANYPDSIERMKQVLAKRNTTRVIPSFRPVLGVYTPEVDSNALGRDKMNKILANFGAMVDLAFKANVDVEVGSHREDAIMRALRGKGGIQLLKGIRPVLKFGLRRRGIPYYEYVPIGTKERTAEYGSRRFKIALRMAGKSAKDFVRPSVWTGRWLPNDLRRK